MDGHIDGGVPIDKLECFRLIILTNSIDPAYRLPLSRLKPLGIKEDKVFGTGERDAYVQK